MLGPTSVKMALKDFVLIFIHITENFLHLRVADRLVEVDGLDARGIDESKQRQHQQEPSEAGNLRGKLRTTVLCKHNLKRVNDSEVHYCGITNSSAK